MPETSREIRMLRWEKKCLEELLTLVTPERKQRLLPMLERVSERLQALSAEAAEGTGETRAA